ncbi:MAG: D-alanyl-D-alanine carboxypeptidase [Lachnospiraceae bacterium]|nr:D-alanyl-D-alanine carboxypeptidase [Lachnospiraceae bacterium]
MLYYITMRKYTIKIFHILAALCLIPALFFGMPAGVYATQEELLQEAEERKDEAVESNSLPSWPKGPRIGAEGAILMDAATGAVLYSKNADEELFPASITKLMCCLVAVENGRLDDVLTASESAIAANSSDGSNMGLRVGEKLTMEELLYGVLINSANEACNVIGEHIAGTMEDYVEMMNQRAEELGCRHTHFVSINGLHNEDHYTCARDMALIGKAFFSHDILCRMASTSRYVIPETDSHLEHHLHSKNKLYAGGEYAYDGIVGSKTGFTSHSRQTLVSCAQRGNMRLICVIMMEESPYQFSDTVALFDYGFEHFTNVNAAANESTYTIKSSDFFETDGDLFGASSPLISIDPDALVTLPDTLKFTSITSSISYAGATEDTIANIEYSYENVHMGSASILLDTTQSADVNFILGGLPVADSENKTYINIHTVIKVILGGAALIALLFLGGRLAAVLFARQKRLNEIKRHRGQVIKSRSALRRDFRSRHRGGIRKLNTSSRYHERPRSNDSSSQKRPTVQKRRPSGSTYGKPRKDINISEF